MTPEQLYQEFVPKVIAYAEEFGTPEFNNWQNQNCSPRKFVQDYLRVSEQLVRDWRGSNDLADKAVARAAHDVAIILLENTEVLDIHAYSEIESLTKNCLSIGAFHNSADLYVWSKLRRYWTKIIERESQNYLEQQLAHEIHGGTVFKATLRRKSLIYAERIADEALIDKAYEIAVDVLQKNWQID
jgi:hypothetical protein